MVTITTDLSPKEYACMILCTLKYLAAEITMLFSYTVRVCSCTVQYVHALSCVHSCALVFVHFITRTLYT